MFLFLSNVLLLFHGLPRNEAAPTTQTSSHRVYVSRQTLYKLRGNVQGAGMSPYHLHQL
jgi:hypothetical protein